MSRLSASAGLGRGHFNIGQLAATAVVLALLAHIWFASTPLPLGGPNIALALVAIALSIMFLLTDSAASSTATLRHRFAPILPVLGVSALLPVWAFTVYLATDTLHPTRLAQMVLGIGVLVATFASVTSERRVRPLAFAFVGGAAASAVFGMAVVWIGDPFLGAWLQIANVSEQDLQDMILFGRNAGLAAHISTFGRQLAVAIPLALAALLFSEYGKRPWAYRCVGAGAFVLLMALVTAMLMNDTRSVVLSVCVVCAVMVLLALRSARTRRRLWVSAPLATLWLTLYYVNPFADTPSGEEATTHVGGVPGDIQELAVGDAALFAGDATTVGHAFTGNRPDSAYELQLRERHITGYGQPGVVNVQTDNDGVFVLTWRQRRDVALYQYRLRRAGAVEWPMWINFLPSLETNGVPAQHERVTLEGVVTGPAWPAGADDRQRLRHRVYGLQPNAQYTVEMVPMTVHDNGTLHHFYTTADEDGVIVVTWLAPRALGVTGYRCRVQKIFGPWQPWQTFETPARVIAPEIALPGLAVGSESLAGEAGDARIGHTFSGFVPWYWYVVQVRRQQAHGLAKLGEVTAKPDTGGNFILTWQEPADAGNVLGHQFRARKVSDAEWLPWQDFVPSLSSRVPFIEPTGSPTETACATGGSEPVRCHTLERLSPGLTYRGQLRARNDQGFGVESAAFVFYPDADGNWKFAWRESPAGGQITGYQFRLWWRSKDRWWPWQDFAPAADGSGRTTAHLLAHLDAHKKNVEAARVAQRLGSGTVKTKGRLTQLLDSSAQTRLHELATVLRYVQDHPFGTGVYAPNRSHTGDGLEDWLVEELLRLWPHNQFLHVWVLFGYLGLALLVAFYACVLRPAIRCGAFVWRGPDTNLRFLAIGVVGAWTAYSMNSMLIPTGPFVGGWSHFFLIGLLFGVERLVRNTTTGAPASGPATDR